MKNKKSLKILAIIVPIILIGIILYLFLSFREKKQKIDALKNIPTFSVKNINGTVITNNDFPDGNKILVYFNPECEYCRAEMKELSVLNKEHENIHWIMFTDKPLEEIKKFAEEYKLDKCKNITWCNDPNSEVYLKFAMKGIPYFLGYNSKNKLVHRSTGAIKIEKLLADFNGK